jgi:PPE-repeat protein
MIPAFFWFPPEINSTLMFSGAGPGPLLGAASAWTALGSDLSAAASSFYSVISGLTSGLWTGPASLSMAAAAAPYVGWLNAAAAQAEAAAAQALAAATAFETAQAATVLPAAVTANRVTLMALIATNFLGQNTPAIAMTELEYLEMWAQDVAAMVGYHAGATAVAATLPAFSAPPVGFAALGDILSTLVSSFVSSWSSLLPVGGLAGLAGQFQTVIAGIPAVLGGAVGQLPATASAAPAMSLLSAAPAPSLLSVAPAPSLASVAQAGMYPAGMVATPMMSLAQVANGAGLAGWGATGVADAPKLVGSSVPGMNGLGGTAAGLGSIGAGVGQARLVGAISVPPTWQGAMPVRIATSAMLPGLGGELSGAAMADAGVVPTAGTPMTPMAVGVGGDNRTGRDGAIPHVVKSRPKVIPRTGDG